MRPSGNISSKKATFHGFFLKKGPFSPKSDDRAAPRAAQAASERSDGTRAATASGGASGGGSGHWDFTFGVSCGRKTRNDGFALLMSIR